MNKIQSENLVLSIKEKGDLKHAIRCTEQAQKRAGFSWIKQACAFRIKMLKEQLSRQQKN